jgi:hypothetical protein
MSSPPHNPEVTGGKDSFVTIEPQEPMSSSTSKNTSNVKEITHTGYLDVPLATAFHNNSTDTLSNLSVYSADNENERISGRLLFPNPSTRTSYLSSRSKSWRTRIQDFRIENRGCGLVLLAQFFGAGMGAATRLLETDGAHGKGMHPFQILFVRMAITVTCSSCYMWWARVPDAPWGKREIRSLLAMRGIGGFFGVFGFYCKPDKKPLCPCSDF